MVHSVLNLTLALTQHPITQGCPQDVKSQDRDGQPSRPRRDWDVPFSQTLKTKTRRSTFKTETRPIRSKNVLRPQCHSLKHQLVKSVTWQPVSCGSYVLFSSWYIRKPDCIAWMFTRRKSRDRDRDVISSRPRRDVSKNVLRPSRDRAVQDRDYIPAITCKSRTAGARIQLESAKMRKNDNTWHVNRVMVRIWVSYGVSVTVWLGLGQGSNIRIKVGLTYG